MFNKIFKFIIGFLILCGFYYISLFIVKITHIILPPAVLGLILFAISLILGIIKEEWIETTVKILLNNMPLLFVPFIAGLIQYKDLIIKNILPIIFVVLITTTLTIVVTGFLTEYGIKILRLIKIRGKHD